MSSRWSDSLRGRLQAFSTFRERRARGSGQQEDSGRARRPVRRGKAGLTLRAAALGFALTTPFGICVGHAQDQHKRKVPVLDKLTSPTGRQAFSGKVESLDLGHRVLSVHTVEGDNVEIFPFKKGVSVSTADGERLRLEALTPGTNVLVYYEQKSDKRIVKNIVVLNAAPDKVKKKPAPPS